MARSHYTYEKRQKELLKKKKKEEKRQKRLERRAARGEDAASGPVIAPVEDVFSETPAADGDAPATAAEADTPPGE